MSINKQKNGTYKLDFYPNGRSGKRIIRVRKTLKECKLLQAEIINKYTNSVKKYDVDKRNLTDLVNLWFDHHGHTLKDSKYRYTRTVAICKNLGNPQSNKFTSTIFLHYRKTRLKTVSISTINHETLSLIHI